MPDMQAQDGGNDQGNAHTAVHDQVDTIALYPRKSLAYEVVDSSPNRKPQHCCMEHPVDWLGSPVSRIVCAQSFNQPTCPAPVCQWIRKDSRSDDQQHCPAAGLRTPGIDRQRRWPLHHALIDSQEPKWREVQNQLTFGVHECAESLRLNGEQEQKQRQYGDRTALQEQ